MPSCWWTDPIRMPFKATLFYVADLSHTHPIFSSRIRSFHPDPVALQMIEFFRETSWAGCLASDGTDHDLPIITRLTGGINAWKGVAIKSEEKKSAKVRAKHFWARLRIAFRLGCFHMDSYICRNIETPRKATRGSPAGRRHLAPGKRSAAAKAGTATSD